MKKYFTLIVVSFLFVLNANSQTWEISFDPPGNNLDLVSIDLNDPNCLWRIGVPNKLVLSFSYTTPNSIVTDLVNPVPSNDTSIFYLKIPRNNLNSMHNMDLIFVYKLDGDSSDFGKIEVSPDYGQTWIDLLTTDTSYQFHNSEATNLYGSTAAWELFDVNLFEWASGVTSHPEITVDTMLFKFTYITGDDSLLHDGWCIDQITVTDFPWIIEGISEYKNQHNILFPNPANSNIFFNVKYLNSFQVQIFNSLGRMVYFNSALVENNIYVKDLPNGLYYLKYSSKKNSFNETLLIQH